MPKYARCAPHLHNAIVAAAKAEATLRASMDIYPTSSQRADLERGGGGRDLPRIDEATTLDFFEVTARRFADQADNDFAAYEQCSGDARRKRGWAKERLNYAIEELHKGHRSTAASELSVFQTRASKLRRC